MIILITTTERNGTSDLASNITGSSACGNGSTRASAQEEEDHTQLDAFLYIIIVLSFYAVSMVLLMIKYIRREEEEMYLDFYYTEYVTREHFQKPRVKNRLALEREKRRIDRALLSFEPLEHTITSDTDGIEDFVVTSDKNEIGDFVVTSDKDEIGDIVVTSDTEETGDFIVTSDTSENLGMISNKGAIINHVKTSDIEDTRNMFPNLDHDGISFLYNAVDKGDTWDLVITSDQDFVVTSDNDDTSDLVITPGGEETTV